jgi:hypothetical protein
VSRLGLLTATAVAVVAAAVLYEAAVAVGAIPIGPTAGAGPAYEPAVLTAAIGVLILGGLAAIVMASGGLEAVRLARRRPVQVIAPVAALLPLARRLCPDPNALPGAVRYAASTSTPGWWLVAIIVAAATAFSLLRRGRAAPGLATAGGVLLAAGAVTWLTGHS